MAYELDVPDIGEGLTEVEIVEWLVALGGEVVANEPLVSVETAKAVVEISSPRSGILLHRGGDTGEVLEVGTLLAVIGAAGETWSGNGSREPAAPATEPAAPNEAGPAAGTPVSRPRAMPIIRKLARELGVDLAGVTGTGASGQITRDDVRSAAAKTAAPGVPTTSAPTPTEVTDGEPLTGIRRAIARNLVRSWEEIPHATVWGPADGTKLLESRADAGGPLEAYLIEALVPVLDEFPDFNATFDGERLSRASTIELGVAVDTSAGLVVPVIRDAGGRNRRGLTNELSRLVTGAQERTLTPADMSGATFTLSNVGAVGGGYGTPIIPHGTTAILSVGRAKDDVVVRNKAIFIAPVMPISLSFDHRVIDGAAASQFLNAFVERIETFAG
jgi:2-oxoisovalerate dehydrogenase E2 component (dihydrolipoyl transacylase)